MAPDWFDSVWYIHASRSMWLDKFSSLRSVFSRSANAAELAISELSSVVSIWNIKQNTVCQVNHADYTCAFAAIELKKKKST